MADQWYYILRGTQYGPVSTQVIKELIASGSLTPDDMVTDNIASAFVRAGSVPQLFAAVPAAPAYAPASAAAPRIAAGMTPEYQSPTVGYRTPGPPEMTISSAALNSLRRTRPWVMFIGILCFIAAAAMILAMCAAITAASRMRGAQAEPVIILAVYVVFAIVYLVAGLYLVSYANRIGRLMRTGNSFDLDAALDAQRGFWKYIGIVAIVVMALYCVAIVFFFALAAGKFRF